MRLDLVQDVLVCPRCADDDPNAPPLTPTGDAGPPGEMETGALHCPRCGQEFAVEEGVGFFSSPPRRDVRSDDLGGGRYANPAFARGYVQTHFRDVIAGDEQALATLGPYDLTGFYSCFPNDTYYRPLAEMLLAKLPPDAAVLDLGCSVGRLSHELAHGARVVVGADPSEMHVRLAREIQRERRIRFRAGEATVSGEYPGGPEISLDVSSVVRDNVVFAVADERSLPFRHFDAIICSAVVDRIPDVEAFLRAVKRHARDGALLLVSSPFDQDERFVPRDRWLGRGAYGAGSGPAEASLRRLARRLGFRPLSAKGVGGHGEGDGEDGASRRHLRWVTYKDRRNHMVWSVHAELFEAWQAQVRRVDASPIPADLVETYQRVFRDAPAYREVFNPEQARDALEGLPVLLAARRTAGDEPVGFAGGAPLSHLAAQHDAVVRALGGTEGVFFVGELGILQEFEGAEVGQVLLHALMGHARANGFHTFALTTSPFNQRGFDFYQRQGFRFVHDRNGRISRSVSSPRLGEDGQVAEVVLQSPYLVLTDDHACVEHEGKGRIHLHFLRPKEIHPEGLDPIASCMSTLFQSAFGATEPWEPVQARSSLERTELAVLAFDEKRQPVAYALFSRARWKEKPVLFVDAIASTLQHRGIGTRIMAAVLERLSAEIVAGRTQNPAFARLLRRLRPTVLLPLDGVFSTSHPGLLEALRDQVHQVAKIPVNLQTGVCRRAYRGRLGDHPVDDAFNDRMRELEPAWNSTAGDAVIIAAVDIPPPVPAG
jgi:SAM-dependent methyltransferase/predicted N-acetyltransferase YhbS/uncharacterized protein YbaR (Trm112 family)